MSQPSSRSVLSTAAAATIGLGALLSGCGSDDSSSSTTTTAQSGDATTAAPSTTAGATSASTTAAATTGSVPPPPSGAQELQSSSANGVSYARYQISGTTADQVVADYQSALQSAGYSVTSTGSGGGGWGKWGGGGAGISAEGDGSYVAVQAGGQSSGPVFFEVCQGANSSAVQECENQSDGPDDDNDDNDQDDDSSSGGS